MAIFNIIIIIIIIIDRDLSAHLPFGSYAEQAMHTKAPSRFTIVILIIAHNFTINKILYFMTRFFGH